MHLANGLPSFTLVGLADTEVKEARERVRAALTNSGFTFPHNKRITVSLAPADLPKESGRFDLPIALGILAADGQLDAERLARHEFAGELSLAGELRPVRGALALGIGAAPASGRSVRWCCPRPARARPRWRRGSTCVPPITCWTWCARWRPATTRRPLPSRRAVAAGA